MTSKHSYVDAYPIGRRCQGGAMPVGGVEVDESSGSSGRPYQWVRSQAELAEVHRTLALMARYLLGDSGPRRARKPLVTLNAFSMGAWATGVNVSNALKDIGGLKSCGPDVDKVLAALEVFGHDVRYVVCGYPPFLQQLLAGADAAGIDLGGYDLVGFVGGEGMTEGLRSSLLPMFRAVWSAYGASDLDIGVAAETPVSVWLRQRAAQSPALAEALFGQTNRLPMVFQYDPSSYHVETLVGEHGAELVVTVLRDTLTPKLRYGVGDAGGVIALADALHIAADHGFSPDDPADGVDQQHGAVLALPLLFIHGRADSTVSFMGANLYPEDVAAGIEDAQALLPGVQLGAFALALAGDVDLVPHVHVELNSASADPASVLRTIETAVRDRLARSSADYRAALSEDPRAATIVVVPHHAGTGPFAENKARIKRRYVLSDLPTRSTLPEVAPAVPAVHLPILAEALRSPSAHNSQPWRLLPVANGEQGYQLHYDHHDYLPFDPDDRDAYLCMGAFLETLSLAAVRHGMTAVIEPVLIRDGSDLHVADITLHPAERPVAAAELMLARMAADRHTNRGAYTREPLPEQLAGELAALGCSLVPPRAISRLVARASMLSWTDRRFVGDLERFCHREDSAPVGMTPRGLMLSGYEWWLLRLAFKAGRLPGAVGWLFSSRDIRLLRSAPVVAVLGADSLDPGDLVAAGRRLVRAWSLLGGLGWATHPISIAVDRPETTPEVATLSGIAVPAAVFRIGRPRREAPRSNRRPLSQVLQPGPVPAQAEPSTAAAASQSRVASSAGRNVSMASSLAATSSGVPNVAIVL